jgi:hypothetical protein
MTVTPPERSDKRNRLSRLKVAAAVLLALFIGVGLGVLVERNGRPDAGPPAAGGTDGGEPTGRSGSAAGKTAGDQFAEFPPRFQSAPGDRYPAQFSTDSMYPRFNPSRRYYVTRCVPGKVDVKVRAVPGSTVRVDPYPARSGNFVAEARLLPGQDFKVGIDTGGAETEYTIRCLPADFPEWSHRIYSEAPVGRFLVSFRPEPAATSRSWSIVFDQAGTPRWWRSTAFNSLGGQVLADGKVQLARGFGDGFGQDVRTAHEISLLDGTVTRTLRTRGTPTDGHEFVSLPNGNSLLMSYSPRFSVDLTPVGLGAEEGVLDGEIQEVTPGGDVVWRWNSGEHFSVEETPERWWRKIRNNPHPDGTGRVRYDIFHLNSIEPWGEQLVVSSRHTDRVFGISRRSGEVLWTFGGEPGPKSLRLVGDDPYASYPLGGNHDARIVGGNVLTVHDNGTNLEQTRRPPRLVRYRLDLKQRTATFLSEIRDPEVAPSSHCCGGARPFGDGWLVAWGNSPVVSGFGPEDRLAFRLWLPVPAYRAVPVPDSVSPAEFERALDSMEEGPPPASKPVRPFRELDP